MTKIELIPERLISVREALGITKTEASALVGMSKVTYGRYESGERNPSIQVIRALAEALNTSVDYLTGNSDDNAFDIIYISKKEKPVLFGLISEIIDADDKTIRSLKKYYRQLKKI